jgi:hypothetical protein
VKNIIADTGLIVSLWSKNTRRREWARKRFADAHLPALTTASNLLEAGFLLENHEIVLRMVKDGDLSVALDEQKEIESLHAFVEKYKTDLADAGVVRLSELNPNHTVATVDKKDFQVYRRFRNEKIPCDFAPE